MVWLPGCLVAWFWLSVWVSGLGWVSGVRSGYSVSWSGRLVFGLDFCSGCLVLMFGLGVWLSDLGVWVSGCLVVWWRCFLASG